MVYEIRLMQDRVNLFNLFTSFVSKRWELLNCLSSKIMQLITNTVVQVTAVGYLPYVDEEYGVLSFIQLVVC